MGCTLSAEDAENDGLGKDYGDEHGAYSFSKGKYPLPPEWEFDGGDSADWGCTDLHFLMAWRWLDTQEMVLLCTGNRSAGARLNPDGTDANGKCQGALDAAIEMALSKTNVEIQRSLGIAQKDIKPESDLVLKMIKSLLQAGISANQPSHETGMTPLMKLCSMQINSKVAAEAIKMRLKIARVLLEKLKPEQVNEADDTGHTALHYLCTTRSAPLPPGKHYAHVEAPLVQELVNYKADLDYASHIGLTPLMYAVMVDNAKEDPQQLDRVRMLVKSGASVDAQANPGGPTALILAALKCKCAGWTRFDDEDRLVQPTKLAVEHNIIRFLRHECHAKLLDDAVVKLGDFEARFPWVQEVAEARTVALLGMSKAERIKLWDSKSEENKAKSDAFDWGG